MDIIPGRENNQPQVEKSERATSAKTEPEEKAVERPSFRRQSEPSRHVKPKKSRFKWITYIVGVVIVLAIAVSAFLFFTQSTTASSIESDKYQAVFFTNGQVYFGKLHTMNNDYMKLTDIFYLQAKTDTTNPQKTTDQTATGVELIKLGNEIHGPEDEMVISKSQVLFFENLKNDSKVSSTIVQYQKK
ncbi:MAG: hypothetical protein NTV39_00485 [Candidatus Saccharibacteria bacterium]|nr:hypothetical protein [Candidatus Saccharibacteria bacterium]